MSKLVNNPNREPTNPIDPTDPIQKALTLKAEINLCITLLRGKIKFPLAGELDIKKEKERFLAVARKVQVCPESNLTPELHDLITNYKSLINFLKDESEKGKVLVEQYFTFYYKFENFHKESKNVISYILEFKKNPSNKVMNRLEFSTLSKQLVDEYNNLARDLDNQQKLNGDKELEKLLKFKILQTREAVVKLKQLLDSISA